MNVDDYAKNILSDPRNEKLVYQTGEDYSAGQIDLTLPPDLSQPNTKNALTLPEIVSNNNEKQFVDDPRKGARTLESNWIYSGSSILLKMRSIRMKMILAAQAYMKLQ